LTYEVLAVDGKTYGPVDLEGLKTWQREGRLAANTRLRELATGRELFASDVPELRPLFGMGTSAPSGYGGRPEPPRCAHCGGAMAPGQTQCAQCGTVPGYGRQPRTLITGSLLGDRILGFCTGMFSWLLAGVGAIGALILYFVIKNNYPVFARSILVGLAMIFIIGLGALAICLAGLSQMGR
jgi:hypothetical protein